MSMDLTGIYNRNEYYTNHYFASIFEENASAAIKAWRDAAQGTELRTPWALLRDAGKQVFQIRDRQERRRGDSAYAEAVTEIARELLSALGYELSAAKPELEDIPGLGKVPVALELSKTNGAPLLWTILTAPPAEDAASSSIDEEEDASDVLGYVPFAADLRSRAEVPFAEETLLCSPMEELLGRLLYDLDESPRWIILISENQLALIDRNKWNEKRFLVFDLDEIFGRNEDTTLQAMAVLLHRESLCPADGASLLDTLDDNSHKHASGVSRDLKYALRQCIEILGNEVVYDMKERQHVAVFGRALAEDLTLQCLRYMYRILFMLFIEAKPELGYAPMLAQAYESGYSFESLREICEQAEGDGEINEEGSFLKDSLDKLFSLVYSGFPGEREVPEDTDSLQGVFTIEPLKSHIFDPERTALIEKAHLRNGKLMQIINLMSLSRGSKGQRRGRISYSSLGVNQLGAVYEALLSYRGFFAEEDLYEVKRAGDKVDELDVGYFIPLRDLDQYTQDERVRVDQNDPTSPLRVHPKGEFIYRLAGREREKSASYYTPEVLTKCLVKYALKELLEGKSADEILQLTVCEPAMGSAAFLNEAISQLAEAYLERKQKETGVSLPHDQRQRELQKVKMLIADQNVYGIDLNPTAVELAEVSLWLNTIFEGGYVPWFRTQIVCGNSLIGARRQCYTVAQAQTKGPDAWYNSAPERVEPGKKRSLRRQQVYHFLLGDPGMCAYTDKVIKSLEPEKIAAIKRWNKAFTAPLDDSEADDILRLCDQIDSLWEAHTQLRAEIKDKTTDPLSVWGQKQDAKHQRTTIRDKDRIYDNLYLSKGGSNASPYARLKSVMDYWCALWFWPIDKMEELPSRMEFLWDVNMLLGVGVVDTSARKDRMEGQFSLFDDVDLDPYARELSNRYGMYGAVNLAKLREDFPRLRIANEIAEQQKFFHWELEFSDVFQERGGFDLVVGNPPWIKLEWDEEAVLGDRQPLFAVKGYKAPEVAERRPAALEDQTTYSLYFSEYISIAAQQSYISSPVNYSTLSGATNLYKCFLPQSWLFINNDGYSAFVHPNGVFDDPKGSILRRDIYQRLSKHFRFNNKELLFADVSSSREFSLNIYRVSNKNRFDMICNLVSTTPIDESYTDTGSSEVQGLFDENGRWCQSGHPDRIVVVRKTELVLFAQLFDDSNDWQGARLPSIHSKQIVEVLSRMAKAGKSLKSLGDTLFTTEMWNETMTQKDKTIARNIHFPIGKYDYILSGANIGLSNPFFKTARRNCSSRYDYDPIDLTIIQENYRSRCTYTPGIDEKTYYQRSVQTPWNSHYLDEYRLVMRKMLNLEGERTLMPSIIPPTVAHIDGLFGLCVKDDSLLLIAGSFFTLLFDFYIKVMHKSNCRYDTAAFMPLVIPSDATKQMIRNRVLLLNCLTQDYASLWNQNITTLKHEDRWAKKDMRLKAESFDNLWAHWSISSPLRYDYQRRQALIELDVLVAMSFGLSLDQLKTIYRIQFPVLQKIEADTWYDANGRIVFTASTNLPGVGFDRKEWENGIKGAPAGKKFYRTITDDTQPGGPIQRTIEYVAPFDKCDREQDYETAWKFFEEKYS